MGSHSLHANRMAATQSLPKVDKMQNLHSKGMFHPPFPQSQTKTRQCLRQILLLADQFFRHQQDWLQVLEQQI